MSLKKQNKNNLRVITTGRTLEEINQAVTQGYTPLVRKVVPSSSIESKYALIRNKKTGLISKIGDYRALPSTDNSDYEILIDFTFYYPYTFPNPFAAYLVPSDIVLDERVYLEDLIEDFIGVMWNQGDAYRLESCEAIWNGNDFDMLYDPLIDRAQIIG